MIISFANQKGGVGKTTSAINLADLAARFGLRVLVVDADVQGHVALSFGQQKGPGLYHLLIDRMPIASCQQQARKNIWVIPSGKETEIAKLILTGMPFRESCLATALRRRSEYDLILIDLAPSLDLLHIAGLMASDYVIIPTKLDTLSLDGVNQLMESIQSLVAAGASIEGVGILPTFFDRVTSESTANLKQLVKVFGRNVWQPIPADTKAREASSYGQTLAEYAPRTPALIGFSDQKTIGGYRAAFERLQEVMHGQD